VKTGIIVTEPAFSELKCCVTFNNSAVLKLRRQKSSDEHIHEVYRIDKAGMTG